MSLFHVMPTALRSNAQQLENLRQQDMETLKQMRILIYGLSDSWKGEAQDALVAGFGEKQATINEFLQTLENYIKTIENAAAKAEQMDADLKARVNRI